MKYLVLLLVVLAVAWYWRHSRDSELPRAARKAPPPLPQDMVECPVCHVHLPRGDALPGPDGQLYCCAEHRSRSG